MSAARPLGDVLAGLSVAGLMLPEAVAYAGIAGLSPGRALIAGIAGGLAYVLVGRSRFAIVSPTSSAAAILAAALASLPVDPASRDIMATALVGCVAAIFLGLGLLRLGGLAGFISRPVLRGFAFGLAVTIIVRQLPKVMGVAPAPGTVWEALAGLFAALPAWHLPSLALGTTALTALIGLRRVPQVPGSLLVIAGGIGLSFALDLHGAGIALAGPAPLTVSSWSLPTGFATWSRLLQLAAPIALILFAESWGTMRNLALRHGDAIGGNRELAALGVANLAAALAQGMPVGAGFSASSANEAAGARSRLAALVASLALLALALWAGPLIARIPEPVLAAVVIAALTHALAPAPLLRLFRINRDQWFALAAAAGVLAFGVLNGMIAAVALSVLDLLYALSHPSISELGRVGGGHDFIDVERHPEAQRVPGVVLFRPNAPLIFANAESVLAAIAARARASSASAVVLSLEESDNLDSTAIDALGEFAQSLEKAGKRVILARAHDRVREVLATAGLDSLASHATFSVADAADRAIGSS